MKKLMYCNECKIETVHDSTEDGWVCWCGNETDAQEVYAHAWADGVNCLTEKEMEAVHNFILAAEAGDEYLGTHHIISGGEVLELGHRVNGGDDLPF